MISKAPDPSVFSLGSNPAEVQPAQRLHPQQPLMIFLASLRSLGTQNLPRTTGIVRPTPP